MDSKTQYFETGTGTIKAVSCHETPEQDKVPVEQTSVTVYDSEGEETMFFGSVEKFAKWLDSSVTGDGDYR